MKQTILNKIKNSANALPPIQKKLAEYIIANYKEAAFLTSTALAAAAEVSESTVIRLSVSLGYSGYPGFQEDLQKIIQNELSSLDRFSVSKIENEGALYQKTFESEVDIINKTLKEMSHDDFENAINLFKDKEQVLVVGFQGSSCLADYAGYTLNKIHPNVRLINRWDDYLYEYINNTNEKTIALIFSFPRYPKITIDIFNILKSNNVKIISFTDSIISPIAQDSDISLIIPMKYASYIDPFAAVMCLINSFAAGISYVDREKTKSSMKKFEEYADKFNIYYKD